MSDDSTSAATTLKQANTNTKTYTYTTSETEIETDTDTCLMYILELLLVVDDDVAVQCPLFCLLTLALLLY